MDQVEVLCLAIGAAVVFVVALFVLFVRPFGPSPRDGASDGGYGETGHGGSSDAGGDGGGD